MAECKPSVDALKAWLKGWDKGHKCKKSGRHPPMLDVDDCSFKKVIEDPRYNFHLEKLNYQISQTQTKLAELTQKRLVLIETKKVPANE